MLGSMDLLLLRSCSFGKEGRRHRLFALSVSCVRTAAAAGASPRFTCMLWPQAPAASGTPAGGTGRRLMTEADVASCAVSGGAAVEEETMALYVPPPMLRGPAKEMRESAEPES